MVAYHRWLIMKPLNAGWVHLIILRVPRGESRLAATENAGFSARTS